jgi:hypothetical protein
LPGQIVEAEQESGVLLDEARKRVLKSNAI